MWVSGLFLRANCSPITGRMNFCCWQVVSQAVRFFPCTKHSDKDNFSQQCVVHCLYGSVAYHNFALLIYKREKATRWLVGGSLIALVGVALVVYNGNFVLKISPLGDFLSLFSALLWAFYSLIIRKLSDRYSAVFITRKVFFYGVITILPFFTVYPWRFDVSKLLEPAILFNLLYLGVLASLICFVVWNVTLKRIGMIMASNYLYLNPVFTLTGSILLLGEHLTTVALIGCVLILSGVYLAGRK